MNTFDVAIIGGGAAGMMAAATVLEKSDTASVVLFEKNKILGQKVIISGGGRCNVTTGFSDIKEVLKKYPRGSRFISYALYEFAPALVREWFEAHGVPLKIEEDLRVFPVSDNGHDVVGVFERIFKSNTDRVQVELQSDVVDVVSHPLEDGKFEIITKSGSHFFARNIVITTGGQAYRHTGSTGDGYFFAQKLGHTITPLGPSLSSFFTEEKWGAACSGVSIEKANYELVGSSRWKFSGPFVFTHKGVSGPSIFALSASAAFDPISKTQPLQLYIDFMPELNEEEMTQKLERELGAHPKKSIANIIDMFFPRSLALALIASAHVSPDKLGAHVSRDERRALVAVMKRTHLTVVGRGSGDEFVTAGGVPTNEVDARTMQSKICPGLYFAGEILDVDGFTGGFNLQASWAGGRLAGKSITASE